MRELIFIAAFVLVVYAITGIAYGQTPCTRYTEPGRAASICQPPRWTAMEMSPGEDYRSFKAPAGRVANLMIEEDDAPETLEEYVMTNIDFMFLEQSKIGMTNLKLVSAGEFITESGERGRKLTFEATAAAMKNLRLRVVQYYFSGPDDRKLFFNGTVAAADTVSERVIDATVKSLEFHNKRNKVSLEQY